MKLDERERRLLDVIEDYRKSECRDLLEAAQTEARAMRADAFRRGRAQLHERALSERANARARLHAARAERETRLRARGDRTNARLLEWAWPRLELALRARWADPRARAVWVEQTIEQARAKLPDGLWTLRHPPDWAPLDWAPWKARLTDLLTRPPRFLADDSVSAGLIIESGGALLDTSLAGLLRDRGRIEARLLAILARSQRKTGEAS